jgi:hypothetical protein
MHIKKYWERIVLWKPIVAVTAIAGGALATVLAAYCIKQFPDLPPHDFIGIAFGFLVAIPVGAVYAAQLEIQTRKSRNGSDEIRERLKQLEQTAEIWEELDRQRERIETLLRGHRRPDLVPEVVLEVIEPLAEIERLIPKFDDPETRSVLHEYLVWAYRQIGILKLSPHRSN